MPEDPVIDPPKAPEEPDKTFTQDEVNRLLATERRKLLAEQPDLTDLRQKAKAYDELQEQSKDELQRERDARAAAEQRAEAAETAAKAKLIDAAVRVAVASANTTAPNDVAALIDRTGLTLADDGTIPGIDETIAEFLKDRPHFAAAPPEPPKPAPGAGDGGPRGAPATGQLSRADLKSMSPEAINEARRAGRLDDLMSGADT